MNLGYCVVSYVHEQGMYGQVCVVTHPKLSTAVSLVETLSGYPFDHERYKPTVYDLTRLYHEKSLAIVDVKFLSSLKQYSPESYQCIEDASQVDYTVQVFSPLGTRHWINRRFESMVEHLNELNN